MNSQAHSEAEKGRGQRARSAPPWRQLLALLYDSLAIAALWVLAAALITLALGAPAEPGTAASRGVIIAGGALHLGYFCISWRLGGQTLGMRAWRLQLVRLDDSRLLGWALCLKRALLATVVLFVPGWLWVPFDRDRCSLHDRLCRTRVRLHQP